MLSFLSPDKGVRLFEELVEWHPLFAELGDESTYGSQTAGEPLHALDVAYRTHVGDGHDFFQGWPQCRARTQYILAASPSEPQKHIYRYSI